MASLPILDVEVREECYETDVLPILRLVRPRWRQGDLHMRKVRGGWMNRLIGCRLKCDEKENDMVLIKIYGKESDYVDRDNEILTMRVLHHVGCGEPVYCRFTNGMAYRYNPGVCLDEKKVCQEAIARYAMQSMFSICISIIILAFVVDTVTVLHLKKTFHYFTRHVAKEMARIKANTHKWEQVLKDIGEDEHGEKFLKPKCIIDDYLRVFLNQIPAALSDRKKQMRLVAEVMDREGLEREVEILQQIIQSAQASSKCLSHLDPNPKNMIYDKTSDRVKFIDWEYSGFYPIGLDIAAFFIRLAMGDIKDGSKHPSMEYQKQWIRWFLEYKCQFEGIDPCSVTDQQVDDLYIEETTLSLVSIFVGALWSLGQIENSTIDLDFIGFSRDWLQVYQERKLYVLELNEIRRSSKTF